MDGVCLGLVSLVRTYEIDKTLKSTREQTEHLQKPSVRTTLTRFDLDQRVDALRIYSFLRLKYRYAILCNMFEHALPFKTVSSCSPIR
eukprot:3130077-Amphidinium_carterae.1